MFPTVTICRQLVAHNNRSSDPPECLLATGSKVTLGRLIAAHIGPGDDVAFPLPNSSTATPEILIAKNVLTRSDRDVYQAPIGYVTQPKKDKRDEFFVAAEVCPANLGISSIFLLCKTIREYFYRISKTGGSSGRQSLYGVLQAMVFLDMPAGLRRGELAGLKWEDFHFGKLYVSVTRSLADQHSGQVKTEASRKLMPIDEYVARDLLAWHEMTPYKQPSDYVWATDANRQAQNGESSQYGSARLCAETSNP